MDVLVLIRLLVGLLLIRDAYDRETKNRYTNLR